MPETTNARPNYSAALVTYVGADNISADGSLPPYAWPGGYPIYYLTAAGSDLCPACASKPVEPFEDGSFTPDETITAAGIHYDGPPIVCEDCGTEIKSAYGDPDEPDAETDDRDDHIRDGQCGDPACPVCGPQEAGTDG